MTAAQFFVANWKMNLPEQSLADYCATLASRHGDGVVETVIAPPFPFIFQVRKEMERSRFEATLAGQNCSEARDGAHTGEVSATMLASVGCQYVIVGHSERRAGRHESDAVVRQKAMAASLAGLVPIVCVGEAAAVRDSGETHAWLERQISELWSEGLDEASLIVAYEPIWAIGTGVHATPPMVEEANGWIKESIASSGSKKAAEQSRLLYGGSVTAENAAELSRVRGVDGFLVGGASLDAEKVLAIIGAMSGSSGR